MFVVTVEFEVDPSKFSAFLMKVQDNAAASLSHEPGCTQFDVCVDPARPGYVFLYEVYRERRDFDAHLASAHFQRFDHEVRAMIGAKRVNLLQRVV